MSSAAKTVTLTGFLPTLFCSYRVRDTFVSREARRLPPSLQLSRSHRRRRPRSVPRPPLGRRGWLVPPTVGTLVLPALPRVPTPSALRQRQRQRRHGSGKHRGCRPGGPQSSVPDFSPHPSSFAFAILRGHRARQRRSRRGQPLRRIPLGLV